MAKFDITLVVDRSGSMRSISEGTVQGINNFIEEQKALPGETTFSMYQFDDRYTADRYKEEFPSEVFRSKGKYTPEVKYSDFQPRGDTALVDAACKVIDSTGERLAKLPAHERPDGVVMVIVTDGLENASTQFTKADLKKRIEHQKEKYNWKFIYLGANQDAILEGAQYGIDKKDTSNFVYTNAGVTRGLSTASATTGLYRTETIDAKV